MAYNYNPQNQIYAGAAMLGFSSEPTIFATPITLSGLVTETAFGDTIYTTNVALISGYVSQTANQYVLATVRNTGEHIIIGDTVTANQEIDCVRGWVGKHPNYTQAIENGGTFWHAIASGYNIDYWGTFIMPSVDNYIEANGVVTVEKTQDVFMTMDNASEYDTYTSKQPAIKLTANLPWNMTAHPQGIGAILSNEIVTDDQGSSKGYSQLIGAISAGQKLTNKLIIVLPKSELGQTVDTGQLIGFSQTTKVVQRHEGAIILWRVGITPKHKDAFDPTKQMELEIEGNANALIGNVYNTAGTTVKRAIVAPGIKNFPNEAHAIVAV